MKLIKRKNLYHHICSALIVLGVSSMVEAAPPPFPTAQLSLVAQSPSHLWNSIVVAPNGRKFAGMPRWPGFENTPSLVEIKSDGSLAPYPGGTWNNWKGGEDASNAFINVNATNMFDGHTLWAVDQGIPPGSSAALPNAPKLVQIDTDTNNVIRVIHFDNNILPPGAALNDIRIRDNWAYLTESGKGSIVVINLKTGKMLRRLANDPSTKQVRPSIGRDFAPLTFANGKQQVTNADPIELSPNGQWLYYAPASGPMYRVPTEALCDPNVSETQLSKQIQFVYDIPTLGGTAMDSKGNLYMARTDIPRIDVLSPDGSLRVLAEDQRLLGGDALFITKDHRLFIPLSQLSNMKFLRGPNGQSRVTLPFKIWSLQLPADSGGPLHP